MSLVLKEPVYVKGNDFWGRPAVLQLRPSRDPGWFMQYDSSIVPIALHNVFCKFRRLTLKGGNYQFNYFEHLAPLRFLGLGNTLIVMSSRMPYFTRPSDIWRQIKDYCEVDPSSSIQWVGVKEEIRCWYPDMRYTQINPINLGETQTLSIKIICDYTHLGRKEETFLLPPFDEQILEIPTQGWPPWLYHSSRIASRLGWPHHRNITWPQGHSRDETLHRFIRHRLVDLLGALSLVHPQRLLVGEVISNCSGHRGDIACVRQAQGCLVEL